MTQQRDDARAYPRLPVELTTELRVDGELRSAHTRDLSLGGVSVYSEQPIPRGRAVVVRLALALGAASSTRFEMAGRVVWCTAVDGDGYQIGARFEALSAGARRQLAGFLRQLQMTGRRPSTPAHRATSSTAERFDLGDDL